MQIDFALEAEREQHLRPADAIYEGCIVRFRPIMMTSVAALWGRCRSLWASGLAANRGDRWVSPSSVGWSCLR
jgi:multidrug efflux pump subunit AcrB